MIALYICLGLLAVLIAIVLLRAVRFVPKAEAPVSAEPIEVDEEATIEDFI